MIFECVQMNFKFFYLSLIFFKSQNDFIKPKVKTKKFSEKIDEMIFILVEKMKMDIAKKEHKIHFQNNLLI